MNPDIYPVVQPAKDRVCTLVHINPPQPDVSKPNRVRQYIAENPARWSEDPENPAVWDGQDPIAVGATGRSPASSLTEGKVNPSCDLEKHHRRSIRLRDYDYSRSGAYFVTVCTTVQELLFGKVNDGEVELNEFGRIAAEEWLNSARIRDEIELDAWIVMPNHVHGIVIIANDHCRGDRPVATSGPRPKSLGAMMAGFKSAATKRINSIRCAPGASVWQRNYYEHVIRNQSAVDQIRQYISDNPAGLSEAPENPAVRGRRDTFG